MNKYKNVMLRKIKNIPITRSGGMSVASVYCRYVCKSEKTNARAE